MARGWESKSIEAQQDAAAEAQRAAREYRAAEERRRPPVSADDVRTRTERAALMLARARALSDLQHACAPAHRAMLELAIADLDRRLKTLET